MAFLCLQAYYIHTQTGLSACMPLGRLEMESLSHSSQQRLDLLTAREAAQYLRVSLSTINRMERRGQLRPMRTPGGHRRYTLEMLNECLSRYDFEAEVG